MAILNELDKLVPENDEEGMEDIVARLKADGDTEEVEVSDREETGAGVDEVVQHIKSLDKIRSALDELDNGDVEVTQNVFDAQKLIRDAILKLKDYADDVYKEKTVEE